MISLNSILCFSRLLGQLDNDANLKGIESLLLWL